ATGAVSCGFATPPGARGSLATSPSGSEFVDLDFVPDVRLRHGETVAGGEWALTALHTPGHAPGHLCLLDEDDGVLIAGDMVASVGTILIAPGEGDMAEYLRQLERLSALGATVALPAHGEPIAEPQAIFRHYITHRLRRESLVLAALAARAGAPATAEALTPEVYADTSPIAWPIARLSLEAHLIKLEQEGMARRDAGGQWLAAERASRC
ncbi:MAG TPA: MBL fold metallo-hydrolase, partial [Candidatus Nanopelagicales bacterium]|nr:MBL fold metallo-hydrolase [Candidatus Nanopelagicales bacterium]